jgi:DNA-binding NarL/FixJ family response regulator
LRQPPEHAHDPSPRVLLVDDHDLFRRGLRTLLEGEGIEVVGEAGTGGAALAELGALAPDVVVMDLNMPGIGGAETTARMVMTAPSTRVLVLSASEGDADVIEAIMSGACGYLLKESSIGELITGIRAAANGESLISPAIASKVLQRIRDARPKAPDETVAAQLSDREMQVLKLVANGNDNAQIAAELHISPKTVKNHISNILMKLQIENRIQAAVFAVRSGLA